MEYIAEKWTTREKVKKTMGNESEKNEIKSEDFGNKNVSIKIKTLSKLAIIIIKVMGVVVSVAVTTAVTVTLTYNKITNKLEGYNERIEAIEKNLQVMDKGIDDALKSINDRIDELYKILLLGTFETINITPTTAFESVIITATERVEQFEEREQINLSNYGIEETTIVAINNDTNEEYTYSDLQNTKMKLSYKEDGKDIIFYGEINENNYWDGDCAINIYNDGVLELITEALYDDGEMLSYRQVLISNHAVEGKAWTISNRVKEDQGNKGISEQYIYKEVERTEEIILATGFAEMQELDIRIGYYNGMTSNGMYNDTTGNAVLIKFDENGYVRTLYKGNVQNGEFNDKTGNAWQIVKTDVAEYIYYNGDFINGERVGSVSQDDIVDIEFIKRTLEDNEILIELNWENNSL